MRLVEKSIARSGTSGLIRENSARNPSGIWIKTLTIEISKFLHPIGISSDQDEGLFRARR
jgi:hypothetical protein